MSDKLTKVLSAVTVSESVIFFYGMPTQLHKDGFDVAISSTDGPELDEILLRESPRVYKVKMEREISLFKDLCSLLNVIRVIYDFKPEIVNAGTPKAGLLYMIASWMLRVPHRVYHVRGLRHESLIGFSEALQIRIEKLCGFLATNIICETQSLMDLALEQNLYPRNKCHVLGPGSSGVELSNYRHSDFSTKDRNNLKAELNIPSDAKVIGFLGRVVPRKGVSELLEAWCIIKNKYPDAYLLIAGPYEEAQPLRKDEYSLINEDPRIIYLGRVSEAARYYSIMDVFTLPAHWEGFGNVLVEAASMGVPCVTTYGTGTRDAAKNGYNSIMVPVKDSGALSKAISKYLSDDSLREMHGLNGIDWSKGFERSVILSHLSKFYNSILHKIM